MLSGNFCKISFYDKDSFSDCVYLLCFILWKFFDVKKENLDWIKRIVYGGICEMSDEERRKFCIIYYVFKFVF